MALETATYLSQLVATNPLVGDAVGQGDDHLRLIKATILATLPNWTAAALASTQAEIDAAVAAVGSSGVLKISAGTLAAPSYSFAADTGTGFYHPAAGEIGVVIAGVLEGQWSSSALTLPTGSINLTAGAYELNGTNIFPVASGNIAANAVTYAKLQSESASTLLGNPTGSAAVPSEITLGAGLGFSGTTMVNTALPVQPAPVVVNLQIVNDGTNPNTQVNITADYAVLINNSGTTIAFSGVSTSIVTTALGAGGMGTTTGTRAASTGYFWWLISNGSVISALGSTQSTLAGLFGGGELPSGYTFAKRIGGNFTDASSNLYRVRQTNGRAQFVITPSTNTSSTVYTTGVQGANGNPPTWVAISLSATHVPSTAMLLHGSIASDGVTGVGVAPNAHWGGVSNGFTYNPCLAGIYNGIGTTLNNNVPFDLVLESASFYYFNSNVNNGGLTIIGWTDPI